MSKLFVQHSSWFPQRQHTLLGQRCLVRRRPIVCATRAAGQGKRSQNKEETQIKCPCGSRLLYRDCCGPLVEGAWARTAPELARARFTAMVSGNVRMLADTTHPEALDAIGTKQSLLRKMEQLRRKRGSGDELQPALVDCAHGPSPDDPNSWLVLLAISVGEPGLEKVYLLPELYRKDGGRWWYMDSPYQCPVLEQFSSLIERYGDGESAGVEPLQGRYAYSWYAIPPRLQSPAMAQRRASWLVDDWPHAQAQQESAQAQQHGSWVYLDSAVDPTTNMTAAAVAAQTRKLLDAEVALRNPGMDWDSYYFRFGRFLE